MTIPAPPIVPAVPDLLMTLARMGVALGRRHAGRDQGPPPLVLVGFVAVLGYLAGRRM